MSSYVGVPTKPTPCPADNPHCHDFPYHWVTPGAPHQFVVILLVILIVLIWWSGLNMSARKEDG